MTMFRTIVMSSLVGGASVIASRPNRQRSLEPQTVSVARGRYRMESAWA